ncbi:methylated-DNA--[protein]-cysteine S-methyltransferase [Paucibacter sediminis]|uniref:Methylated-DNA--[protein]-cysteine S-methyltransferase n=1 Tax=Paucibacter sediminis TaxID=3019553 RepID=A0AA95SKP4_9BURK|nr:methylated-DNA--[protein]-cysteine S-methyltransferase [Paucibacter sp. S2-9]WIT11303.1 methylated-DNA--[protein]-cysteine S-methyltransferase [Paucibacter sp. S2-9]
MNDRILLFFHCYDTALGCCGIAWGERGIVGAQLPEESAAATRDRMRVRFPTARETAAPPAEVWAAIEGVQALLRGEPRDLLEFRLDETGIPAFNQRVHALTRRIPVGQTRTYGELAQALGLPGAARAVGQAEGHNPFAPIVPCHRVMGAGGVGTGFSAHGGVATKLRLLAIEARATGQMAGEQSGLFG